VQLAEHFPGYTTEYARVGPQTPGEEEGIGVRCGFAPPPLLIRGSAAVSDRFSCAPAFELV